MSGPRTLLIGLVVVLLVACVPEADDARPEGSSSPDAPSRGYALDCGDVLQAECEDMAARFVADIRDTDPAVVVVAVSFPDPGMIDATLSDGNHVSTHIEPAASAD